MFARKPEGKSHSNVEHEKEAGVSAKAFMSDSRGVTSYADKGIERNVGRGRTTTVSQVSACHPV